MTERNEVNVWLILDEKNACESFLTTTEFPLWKITVKLIEGNMEKEENWNSVGNSGQKGWKNCLKW